MMPAISAGLGTAYGFARALGISQQAYNRYLIGGASGAAYAVLRARQVFGVRMMAQRAGMNQNTALPPGSSLFLKNFTNYRSAFLSENKRSNLLFMGTINPAR